MEPCFIHLRLHTEYSLQDGLVLIPALMEKAKQYGMPAASITDLSNLYGTIKFYQAALQAGIKPIIGADVWVEDEKNPAKIYRLTLICQTNEGYHHLLKLISRSYLEGSQTQPTLKKSWFKGYTSGLIALSGAEEGDIGEALLGRHQHIAEQQVDFWLNLFPNRFYLEISRVGKFNEEDYIQHAIQLAISKSIPIVATNNVRFLEADDFDAHEARVCIQQGTLLNDPKRSRAYTAQQYFRNQEEMRQLFADLPEALENSVEIAKRCNVKLILGKNLLPHFPIPSTYTIENYLSEMTHDGLKSRLLIHTKTPEQIEIYHERLKRELDVINKMGFAGYFLIVADFIKWAKANDIPVGPGRGSGPGSLVAYALHITDLDPIALDLLFERFLNPERVSMPDFDIDFCIEGRDRVIEYVMEKHGHESVSQIITYGTMAAKAVVRDVGRVLGLPYGFVDKIAKLIPFELGITLEKALQQEPLLKERYEQEEEVKTLIDLANKLEGLARNVGKHAGGIVIAPGKLTDFIPLYCEMGKADHPVTQFDKDDVETVGLVKFDFLGLKTLTIINRALKNINANRLKNHEAPIDINLIPLDDDKTFKLLKNCQSTAVFQLESHGMRDLIKRLQPDCFEDLVALVALFRPGPLQSGMVDDFINRKHGRAAVNYPHPHLEPVLRPTYGVILYQEQVMQIAQVLAAYTLGAADILRRAMGKKKPEEMAKQREIFCDGAITRGVRRETATAIFDLMEKFAGYGFNRSHSAAYALIAYQTAWLKAHYPAAFMAAVLSSDMDKTDKILGLLEECKILGLTVTPPDINKNSYFFDVLDDKTIMYGLGAIKGVGETLIQHIIEVRSKTGVFTDLFDFCQRTDPRKMNKRAMEALIKSGSFDALGPHRGAIMASLSNATQLAEQSLMNKMNGQHDFFDMTPSTTYKPQFIEVPPWEKEIILQYEKETLGFYLSGHPLHAYLMEIKQFTTSDIADLHPSQHKTARACGIISAVRTRQTKRGDRIAIFSLDDGKAQIEVVCFSECFQTYRTLITEDQLVVVEGEISLDDFSQRARMVCRSLYTLDEAREKFAKSIRITLSTLSESEIGTLTSLLSPYQGGQCTIIISHQHHQSKADITLGKNWLVKPANALLTLLSEKLGSAKIEVIY